MTSVATRLKQIRAPRLNVYALVARLLVGAAIDLFRGPQKTLLTRKSFNAPPANASVVRCHRIACASVRREARNRYQRELRAAAPRRTGRLRGSIRVTTRCLAERIDVRYRMVFYGRILNGGGRHQGWIDKVTAVNQQATSDAYIDAFNNCLLLSAIGAKRP